ncbi:hypothetical protein B0E51_18935 [Rhodanobacter sp. C05]|nr:hypothetical protein B0E51_18935 [Rhodanobacter sp. C05]
MTVEQSDKIDSAGLDRGTGAVVLNISDHLPWNDEHFDVLERKLGSYVRFIESGQVREQFPSATGQCIKVYLLHRPTESGLRFLAAATESLKTRGISFLFGPLPLEGYSGDPS